MTPTQLAHRMQHIAPFEVMEIQTAARALEREGHDIIHMEIGEPDFATPPQVIEAAKRALTDTRMAYTSALGIAPLREAIAGFYQSHYGVTVDPARIVVTAGSSAALLLTFGVLLNAGDEVLMADPGYPCNRHFVRTLDAVPVPVAAGAASGYQLTASDVAAHWGSRTRAALVASPSNPTGTVVTPDALAAIHREVSARGGTLVVDEIYQGLTYDLAPATALSLPNAADDVFVINSFSKYFHMTGWRLGWVVAPADAVRALETLAQNLFISPSAIAQHAALAAFQPDTLALLETRRQELQARRDYLVPALRRVGFGVPVMPQGAFYVYAESSALAADSFALSRDILHRAHVAATPGKDFGHAAPERHMRFAYTQSIARLEEAVSRIASMGASS